MGESSGDGVAGGAAVTCVGDVTATRSVRRARPAAAGMRTLVEVVARRGPAGRTLLPVVNATGQVAVRRTGEHRIHLVASAYGPIGGDSVVIWLRVEEGARLEVCSVAASVCLPSRKFGPSISALHAEVAEDARLDVMLEPTVVASGAEHHARTDVCVAVDARLRVTERVVLGRHGEDPGRWRGTSRIERDGSPILHTTVELGPSSPMWQQPTNGRVYVTDLVLEQDLGAARSSARTGPAAVRLPLPGGWVTTAWGDRLEQVLANVDAIMEL